MTATTDFGRLHDRMQARLHDPLQRRLVLVVDDVPADLHATTSALRADYRIKTATSGQSALDFALREDTPDLILLDVTMPHMSGHEVMRRLRLRPQTRDIPVILMTVDASGEAEVLGLDLGACDFLAKPVHPQVLQARVRRLLRQRQCQQELVLSELKLRAMLDSSTQYIGLLDVSGRVLHLNRPIQALVDVPLERLVGQRFWETPLWSESNAQQNCVRDAVSRGAGGMPSRFETRHTRIDGEALILDFSMQPVFGSHGEVAFLLPEATDVTEQKQAEENIRQLANYDPLTGLPNRTLLTDRVTQAIRIAERSREPLGLMFIDLDRFKHINDTLGHACGDKLLMEVAGRLVKSVRLQDTVARIGGDEFVLLLPDTHAGGAMVVAEKLLRCVAQTCVIEGNELAISPSIGIAMYPSDGQDFATLSKGADIAMYRAKREGRNMYRFFTQEMQERSTRMLQIESQLRHAIDREELALHYQPQICLASGRCTGVEALLRWNNAELGSVAPAEFIPLAEETGLILPIGEWVLRTALAQAKAWVDAGWPLQMIAVNLSAVQLRQKDLPETVCFFLREAQLPPGFLELELTESAAFSSPDSAFSMLEMLHARGLKLSIDDFGTGYSSLSYLKRVHIDKLKIDQSFVRDLGRDLEDEALVEAIIGMAQSLKLRTIAEGVETAEQLEYLRDRGCHEVQGYYYSRPLPPRELERWLQARAAAPQ